MRQATVAELQTRLNELLDLAAAGEEVRITRQGRPIVRLVPEPLSPEDADWAEVRRWVEAGPTTAGPTVADMRDGDLL